MDASYRAIRRPRWSYLNCARTVLQLYQGVVDLETFMASLSLRIGKYSRSGFWEVLSVWVLGSSLACATEPLGRERSTPWARCALEPSPEDRRADER